MEDFDRFWNRALKFLSYRPRSEKEVRDNLGKSRNRKIEVDENLVDRVIEKLRQYKFVNDEEFTRWWIEQRSKFKPRALRVIQMELKQKGISREILDSITNEEFLISNELEMAKKLVQKRIKRYQGLEKRELYEKLGRFLASKGFNWDTVKKAIDEELGKEV